MAELVQLIPDEDEETDHKILELRVAGSSVVQIARQLGVPRHDVSRRLDRNLPQVDASFRRRAIALSLLRLDELTEAFHKQAKAGDIEAGNLMVRLECERRALLDLTGSNYNPIQLVANNTGDERSTDALERALAEVAGEKLVPSDTEPDKA
jgi:hypothetical protein